MAVWSVEMLKSKTNRIYNAVALALLSSSVSMTAFAAEEPEETIEEVVVEGSRLQGTAQAVLEERKNQAFVADIMGAEQISRTGDSDAASALRRVTGLTLVDGKFIYVRGLGERYSATQLDSMIVPSPDPTRSVLPLDLFPSGIIESLNVQKAYSPDLPAHFAGGNVDIRIKSIPEESIFKVGASLGINTNNSGSSPWYSGGGDDWQGRDDGSRAMPRTLANNLRRGLNNLSSSEAVNVLSSMNRDYSAAEESIDPDYGFDFTLGDRYDFGENSRFGYLASFAYKNEWTVSNERNVNNLSRTSNGIKIQEFADGASTEHNVKVSGMLNFGFDFNESHRFEFNNLSLRDTRDRLRNRLLESTNTIDEPDDERRQLDVLYEEREMMTHQVKGTHNFADWNNLSVDWYYSTSEAERYAPGALEAFFRVNLENGTRTERLASDVDTKYMYQYLIDDAKNWGGNIALPFFMDNYTFELKAGADFVEKQRYASNVDVAIQTFAIPSTYLQGSDYSQIFSDQNLAQSDFSLRLDDQTTGGDKYRATTLIDAFYLMADYESGNWRYTGGLRYEDFRQVSIPYQPHTNFFDVDTAEIEGLIFQEDDIFASIAATYIVDAERQWRFNFSQTAIRPDLRDISTTFYIDPLTEFLVRGSTSLQSSAINNVDVRWEWYMPSGENLSVAFFAKDIDRPIEMIELPSATEGAPQLLTANAESGEVYGVEVEFLKDLTFLGDNWSNYFVSGNVTLSDSQVDIGLNSPGTSLFEQQLAEALETNQGVTEVITNNKRRLIGHSEWVMNLQLGWDSLDNNHSATVIYNAFGPRIIVPGVNGFEDGEEKPFHSLDMVYTWYPSFDSTVKVRLKNILDQDKEIEQEGVTILRENPGTELSVSFSTNF